MILQFSWNAKTHVSGNWFIQKKCTNQITEITFITIKIIYYLIISRDVMNITMIGTGRIIEFTQFPINVFRQSEISNFYSKLTPPLGNNKTKRFWTQLCYNHDAIFMLKWRIVQCSIFRVCCQNNNGFGEGVWVKCKPSKNTYF